MVENRLAGEIIPKTKHPASWESHQNICLHHYVEAVGYFWGWILKQKPMCARDGNVNFPMCRDRTSGHYKTIKRISTSRFSAFAPLSDLRPHLNMDV
jgi:hypothetical protein